MNPQEGIYYESHVTIKPVDGEKLAKFHDVAQQGRFNVATFTKDTAGPDSMICTGRDKDRKSLEDRMFAIVAVLKGYGFQVTRYKLESTLVDSRWDDSKLPLKTLDERYGA